MNFKSFAIRSFRQKFFLSYLVLLILFLALMFPFVAAGVQKIVHKSMCNRADELVAKMLEAKDEEELIQAIKEQKHYTFIRIALLDNKQRLLYDSHTRRLMRPLFFPFQYTVHPEVEEALLTGQGYAEGYSHILGQKLIYVAKSFTCHGKTYVMRLAFPYRYTQELRHNFEMGFLLFSSLVLILFSAMAGFVLHRLTRPIRQIIDAIKPYQQGMAKGVAKIELKGHPQDDFIQLASTLNSLSDQIRSQIQSLTHERNEKEAILESLAEGVLAVDHDLTISYANGMALRLLGLDRNDLGKRFSPHLHPRYFELLSQCHQEGNLVTDALQVTHNDQTLFLNILVCPRENKRGAILVLQDKSIHYKILEMRKEFIANASHELKTPITIIRGFAEALHDNLSLPRETIVEITEKIVHSCERMTRIIKNLLTLADIENIPRSRIAPLDLVELACQCRSTLLAVHTLATVELVYDEASDFTIMADEALLEVALMNLLDNAAKYAKEFPKIEIIILQQEDFIKISVKDNGIGIPESDLERIFERFFRVNKMYSKKIGGSGLGLSIVETIVEKHGGKIYVESLLGQGSTFSLELPSMREALKHFE